jgi:NADPH:quinone reductase-like Zn-dependent oxidoreductase
MKAAQGKELGDIDEMLTVEDNVPMPNLDDLPPKTRKTRMIIQTKAVALACGDVRVLSGRTRELQGPPSFPYIPGGDCSGIVWEIPNEAEADDSKDKCPFQVGDRVAARFVEGPRGALAEYAVVDTRVCEKIPDTLSFEEGAALASVAPATLLGERIREGERVLILGAGGGVGSHVCQVMRYRGAAYLVGVSRNPERLLQAPLKYDKAIDYTKENPFTVGEFTDKPFDVVVDLVGGFWLRLLQDSNRRVVKPASQGGRYLTLTPDEAVFDAHSLWPVLQLFLFVPLWRAIKSRLWARYQLPKYTFAMSLDVERSHLTRTFDMATSGTLNAVIDSRGPFPFTTEGVRQAFRLQETRHINGKTVISLETDRSNETV